MMIAAIVIATANQTIARTLTSLRSCWTEGIAICPSGRAISTMTHRLAHLSAAEPKRFGQARIETRQQGSPLELPEENAEPDAANTERRKRVDPVLDQWGLKGRHHLPVEIDQSHR